MIRIYNLYGNICYFYRFESVVTNDRFKRFDDFDFIKKNLILSDLELKTSFFKITIYEFENSNTYYFSNFVYQNRVRLKNW